MRRILPTLVAAATVAILPHCGSAPAGLAGGSGAGNPGAVTLAVSVDTTAGLTKRNTAPTTKIKDDDSLDLTVTDARVIVQRIEFMLDPSQSCDEIGSLVKPPLVYESCSIILDSAVTFNVMTGAAEPPLGTLALPPARYTGIRFTIAPDVSDSISITLAGTFVYDSVLHKFAFLLSHKDQIFYHYNPDGFTVSSTDTANLLLMLDAQQWLAGCRIKRCLDNGGLGLDSAGNLTVYDSTGSGECGNVGKKAGKNIASSGKLKNKN